MKYILQYTLLTLILISCQQKKQFKSIYRNNATKYAKGFDIKYHRNHAVITLNKDFTQNTQQGYIIIYNDTTLTHTENYTVIKTATIQRLIANSTTQIPFLESVDMVHLLKGFPNTDLISSTQVRKLIGLDSITDLGHELQMNTELVLELNPDLMITHQITETDRAIENFKRAGIPVFLDANWLEETPLGRAEWIKLYGAIFNKKQITDSIFNHIEQEYNDAKSLVSKVTTKPTLMSGSIFQDVWHSPAGNSYMAQIYKDAGTHYVWENTPGTGSLFLNFEQMFNQAKEANYWFSPGMFISKNQLLNSNHHYNQFQPFKNDQIFTYAYAIGETGGLIFFEMGNLRPDLILKDIIRIIHPEVLPDYTTTFYQKLK